MHVVKVPGLCYFRFLNHALFNLMKMYPDKFRDGYKIGSVYGTFPGAIWNGGRSVMGTVKKEDMYMIPIAMWLCRWRITV